MVRFPMVLFFIAVAFMSWGVYGPVLHEGQHAMGQSLLRPFVCVGVAYFLIAVVVPLVILRRGKEPGHWTASGAIWSFAAGTVGAIGALGIILAFQSRGKPVYVMPLVFGFAPVVNTFVTMWMTRTAKQAGAIFYLGVIIVAAGAAGVLVFKPKPVVTAAHTTEHVPESAASRAPSDESDKSAPNEANESPVEESESSLAPKPLLASELMMIILSIAATAICWGSYGPVLHKGQAKMAGSRLRPFLCVGLAYFAIAVVVPLVVLSTWAEPGAWTIGGSAWALGAGAFGAIGALGIILAFNFGGKPIYVMPLVFGGAPVVNTFTSIVRSLISYGTIGEVDTKFFMSLMSVIVGAVLVLVFSPKPQAPKPESRAVDDAAQPQGKAPAAASSGER